MCLPAVIRVNYSTVRLACIDTGCNDRVSLRPECRAGRWLPCLPLPLPLRRRLSLQTARSAGSGITPRLHQSRVPMPCLGPCLGLPRDAPPEATHQGPLITPPSPRAPPQLQKPIENYRSTPALFRSQPEQPSPCSASRRPAPPPSLSRGSRRHGQPDPWQPARRRKVCDC